MHVDTEEMRVAIERRLARAQQEVEDARRRLEALRELEASLRLKLKLFQAVEALAVDCDAALPEVFPASGASPGPDVGTEQIQTNPIEELLKAEKRSRVPGEERAGR